MGVWNAPDEGQHNGSSGHDTIAAQATHDAWDVALEVYRTGGGINDDGSLQPVAVAATYRYLDRLRQESQAIPRWSRSNLDAQREYIQRTGDHYYMAFLQALKIAIAREMMTTDRIPPRTTPLPQRQAQAQPRLIHRRKERDA